MRLVRKFGCAILCGQQKQTKYDNWQNVGYFMNTPHKLIRKKGWNYFFVKESTCDPIIQKPIENLQCVVEDANHYIPTCLYSVPTVKRKRAEGKPKRKERIGNLRCNIFPPSCFSHSQLDTDSCPLSCAFNLTEVNPGKSAHTPLSLPN